jgi:hypothetical protein
MLSTFTLSVAMSLMATDEQALIDSNATASNDFFRLNTSFSSSKEAVHQDPAQRDRWRIGPPLTDRGDREANMRAPGNMH